MMISFAIFVLVTLAIVAGSHLVHRWWFADAWEVRRRLAREFKQADDTPAASPLFKSPDRLTLEPPDDEPDAAAAPAAPASWRERWQYALEQANFSWSVNGMLALAGGFGVVLAIAGYLFGNLLLAAILGVAGPLLPFLLVRWRRRQRQEAMLRQLPSAFELMAQVMRAGQSVPQSLQAVVDAFDDPLSGEFAHCQAHVGLGLRPDVTFRDMAQRSGLMEMRIFVMAVLIQQQTGGNLSEVLDRLAGMVRARLKLRNHVRSLTAEGRLQGWTLVVLPFIVFATMMVVNRQYAETLLENSSLLLVLGMAMAAGIVWIRRIVNFDF